MAKHRSSDATKLLSILLHLALSFALAGGVTYVLLWPLFITYFIGVNIITFFSFGRDKAAAKGGMPRTPEATYLTLAALGAWPGLFFGRILFNHKTSKKEFIYPMWALFFIEVAAVLYYFYGV